MLSRLFHQWERRLAASVDNRVVRPFEWGADWIPEHERRQELRDHEDPSFLLQDYVGRAMADTQTFFAVEPARRYGTSPLPADAKAGERMVTFPSALVTPHPANNTVYLRYFPATPKSRQRGATAVRRAVVVLPQWNAHEDSHVALCRLLNAVGISAVRISLPYHDRRMPPELERADYIISSNVGRTLQVCRQAILDTRRAVAWLHEQGYERIGLVGTSLGSCLSMLTGAHEPLVSTMALNHVSAWFADVIWDGLSTSHVRQALEGHISLPLLRELWDPLNPRRHVDKVIGKPTLLVYALFDLSFPLHLSREFVHEYRQRDIPLVVRVLPCGHYTTGVSPFRHLDAYYLVSYLNRSL
jgi:hypothetical protein